MRSCRVLVGLLESKMDFLLLTRKRDLTCSVGGSLSFERACRLIRVYGFPYLCRDLSSWLVISYEFTGSPIFAVL